MKRMQKTLVALLCFVCVISVVATLFACTPGQNGVEKTVTIVIGEGANAKTETVTTGAVYLFDVLNELHNRETNPLALDGQWGTYGLYVTTVGDVAATESNQYICVLTSDTKYQDITEWAVTKQYNGTNVVSATLGVSSLPLTDGGIYMFVLASY